MTGLDGPTLPMAPTKGRAGGDGWRSPQHRDGMALVLSSGVASGIGLLFWLLAAQLFDRATVGLNSTAVAAITLLGSAAHLNLGNALLRFVPVAGRRAGAVVAGSFAAGAGMGVLLGLAFVAGASWWAPELVEAYGYPVLLGLFLLSAPVYTLFVLQDAALTALKRADLVLVENFVYALLKLGLLVLAAWAGLAMGIVIGTVVATALVVLVVVAWLARRLRAVAAEAPATAGVPVTVRDLATFIRADYAGNLCWQAAVFGLPLVVIALAGPDGAATYNVVWQIAFGLYMVALGMGKSMVAHTASAADLAAAADRARRGMERKALTLIVPGAVVAAAASYPVLSLFGRSYAETGSLLLVLLALSAIPNVITNATVWAARVRRQSAVLVGLPAALSVGVFAGCAVLVPALGVVGAGWAWLGTQTVLAAAILVRRAVTRSR